MVRVSAITPTYNRAEFLGDAIETALRQTYEDIEIVVVNDGSTDETRDVLDRYADDDRVRVLHNDRNRGMTVSWNRGAAIANGEFLCILDDDDRWHPTKVQKQVAFMDRLGENYAVVYTGGVLVKNGRVVNAFVPKRRGVIYPEVLGSWGLEPHSGHMIRKSCFEAVGGFDTDFESNGDWDLSIRLAKQYEFEYIAQPLVERITHGDNASERPEHAETPALTLEKYREELARYPALERELRGGWEAMRGRRGIDEGRHYRAVYHYWRAFGYEPTAGRFLLAATATLGPDAFDALGTARGVLFDLVTDYERPSADLKRLR
jgi:glycosyltransferase involved in cell wall biosynthesis